MASLVRRLQRQVVPSQPVHVRLDMDGDPVLNERGGRIFYANPPREKFWQGRGSKLGTFNPKGAEYLARKARDAKWGRA